MVPDSGSVNAESNTHNQDKNILVSVKETALLDVGNEYRIPSLVGSSPPLSKVGEQEADAINAFGTKNAPREDPMDLLQLPSGNAIGVQLAYVHRTSDVKMGKGTCGGGASIIDYASSRHGLVEETVQPNPHIKEPMVSCAPIFAPTHAGSLISAPGKPTAPASLGRSSTTNVPTDSDSRHIASALSSLNIMGETKDLHWEERYKRLQILLKKLDESYLEDYVHILRSVSSVELRMLAIELEKRSMKLSMEEGREMQRVGALNVIGKPPKEPSVSQAQVNK